MCKMPLSELANWTHALKKSLVVIFVTLMKYNFCMGFYYDILPAIHEL